MWTISAEPPGRRYNARCRPIQSPMAIYLIVASCALIHAGFAGAKVALPLHALHLGLEPFTVGVMMALWALCPMMIALWVGKLVDRIGPRAPMIGGTAGVDPASGELAGPDVFSQTKRILESFRVMLESVGSDLEHVVHLNVFLKDVRDFEEMNRAYVEAMGDHRPARTVIGVRDLPKSGALLTMNLTAVVRE